MVIGETELETLWLAQDHLQCSQQCYGLLMSCKVVSLEDPKFELETL